MDLQDCAFPGVEKAGISLEFSGQGWAEIQTWHSDSKAQLNRNIPTPAQAEIRGAASDGADVHRATAPSHAGCPKIHSVNRVTAQKPRGIRPGLLSGRKIRISGVFEIKKEKCSLCVLVNSGFVLIKTQSPSGQGLLQTVLI